MTTYYPVSVNISDSQAAKVRKAAESKQPVSIKLTYDDLSGEHVLHLTKTQVVQVEKSKAGKKGLIIKLSKAQLKHNVVSGGFLGAILPFLATAAKTVLPALVGGMAMAGGAKAVDAIDQAVKGRGMPKVMYFKKGNQSVKATRVGEGLYLSPWKGHSKVGGDGIYLKPYGAGYISGKGFFTGTSPENSPVAKVPILGQIPLISDLLKMIV